MSGVEAVSSLIKVLGSWLRHVDSVLWKMGRNQKPIEENRPRKCLERSLSTFQRGD